MCSPVVSGPTTGGVLSRRMGAVMIVWLPSLTALSMARTETVYCPVG